MSGLLVVLGVALISFLAWQWFPPRNWKERGAIYFIQEAQWEDRILRLTHDNRSVVERAVTDRRRKFPNATRLELLKMVHAGSVQDRKSVISVPSGARPSAR